MGGSARSVGHLHGQRPVDEQHVVDVERRAQRVADECARESRCNRHRGRPSVARLPGHDGGDGAILVQFHPLDRGDHVAHAERLRVLTEQGGESPGVEVVGVVQRAEEVAVAPCASGRATASATRFCMVAACAKSDAADPPLPSANRAAGPVRRALAGHAEGMEVVVCARRAGRPHPVDEFDALLEGRRRIRGGTAPRRCRWPPACRGSTETFLRRRR